MKVLFGSSLRIWPLQGREQGNLPAFLTSLPAHPCKGLFASGVALSGNTPVELQRPCGNTNKIRATVTHRTRQGGGHYGCTVTGTMPGCSRRDPAPTTLVRGSYGLR